VKIVFNITFKNPFWETLCSVSACSFLSSVVYYTIFTNLSSLSSLRLPTFKKLTFAPHVLVFCFFVNYFTDLKQYQKWVSPTYGTRIQDATAKDPVTGKSYVLLNYFVYSTYGIYNKSFVCIWRCILRYDSE